MDMPRLDWVICGGESGPHARPMHPEWARSIRDQVVEARKNFFFKQWGEFAPGALNENWDAVPNDGSLSIDDPRLNVAQMTKVGKKSAGRALDGREWNEVPREA
jgi:protein gp37